jgi:hypothetical protein
MKEVTILPQCYKEHKPLTVEVEGKTLKIWGGSASFPENQECDVYVSLQEGSSSRLASDAWDAGQPDFVQEIYYAIRDQHAPKNGPRFKRMITWVCNRLHEGKEVHVGCIGGHGRTGMALAAIYAVLTGKDDGISYVRANYCKKAVETQEQVDFLHQHFGCKKEDPRHMDTYVSVYDDKYASGKLGVNGSPLGKQSSFGFCPLTTEALNHAPASVKEAADRMRGAVSFKPLLKTARSIWGIFN